MNKVKAALLTAIPLAAMLSVPAVAASFVKYTFTGQMTGTRTIQPSNAAGWSEAVTGTASFDYVIPLNVVTKVDSDGANNALYSATSGYFLGARGEWSASGNLVSFFERGFGNAGVANFISASACLPLNSTNVMSYSGSVDSSCGAAVIRDTERGMTLDLHGSINSFSAQVIDSGTPQTGLNSYSLAIGAVPEPSTWAMLLFGFGMMGAALRYRRRSTNVSYA